MEFSRRNVSKTSRNGELIITRGGGNIGTSSSGGGGGTMSGNYLPATLTENGLYIVDLATVKFSGNIYAGGEISAFGQGGGGTTSSGNTEILDTLTSSSVTAALSANQGRVLNDKLISFSGNTYNKAQVDALLAQNTAQTVDLSNYYTKEQTYSKTEVDEKISGYTGNYLPATKNEDNTYTVDLEEVRFNGRIVATSEISAYGAGEAPDGIVVDLSNYYTKSEVYNKTETYTKAQIDALFEQSGSGTNVDLSNYYTKTEVNNLIDGVEVDLSDYFTKDEVNNKLNGYSPTSHTHSNYSVTGHTHSISNITNLQTTLDGKSGTGHTHSNYSVTSHTHDDRYYTESEITTKLNGYSKTGHTHSNYFATSGGTISGDLYVTGKIYADGEISAYGDGGSGSGGSGAVEVIDNLTSTSITAALSANQGRELNDKFNQYYTKAQIDNTLVNYTPDMSGYLPLTGGTMSNQTVVTNLNADLLDGYSGSAYAKKTDLSGYSTTAHTHDDRYFTESEITTKLAGKSDTSHTHSNYSVTSHTHAYSTLTSTAHTHSISNITNLQSSLDGKSGTGHTHSAYSKTGHTHAYSEITNTAHTHSYLPLTGGTVSGTIVATGEITAFSDARLKKNIEPLQNRGKLNPVTYLKDGKQCIGFVAQDVNEIYPELVLETPTDEKYLSVNYPQITAVLSAQINELYDVIDKLKKEIKELKNNK